MPAITPRLPDMSDGSDGLTAKARAKWSGRVEFLSRTTTAMTPFCDALARSWLDGRLSNSQTAPQLTAHICWDKLGRPRHRSTR